MTPRVIVVTSLSVLLVTALPGMAPQSTWERDTFSPELIIPPGAGHPLTLRPPPTPPPQPLMWSAGTVGGTWNETSLAAAAYEEGGFSDWRLPTIGELRAAVTDNVDETFGQYDPSFTGSFWTSSSQGNWSYVITVATDSSGYPDPDESGAGRREPKNGLHPAKLVRP